MTKYEIGQGVEVGPGSTLAGRTGVIREIGEYGVWLDFLGGPMDHWVSKEDLVDDSPNVEALLRVAYPHGHPAFIPTMLDLIALHSAKNADYAGTGRPLGNFERVSKALAEYGVFPHGPASVALIYMMKQVDAVMYAVGQGRTLHIESVGDRLQDVAVYAILAKIMLEEKDSATDTSSLREHFGAGLAPA